MKLNYEQLKAICAQYIDASKIAVGFTASSTNTAGLIDKIGRMVNLDTTFIDKLDFMDGEPLAYGRTIEEWAEDLILPQDFDATGANNMAPNAVSYRPASYSFDLGAKTFGTRLTQNDLQKAVHSAGELADLVASKTKKLYDSRASFKYAAKREILAKFGAELVGAMDTTGRTSASASANASVGTIYKHGSPAKTYLCVKAYTANDEASVDKMIEKGYLIEMKTSEEIAIPVDTTSGEAFVKRVKELVEIATDESEGYSLNGNSLGAAEGLVLIVKNGVMPTLEVDVQAGAFNGDKVALPCEVKRVKDFGSDSNDIFAILMDKRAAKLVSNWEAVLEDINGKGAFTNVWLHTGNTGYYSRNVFAHVFVEEQSLHWLGLQL